MISLSRSLQTSQAIVWDTILQELLIVMEVKEVLRILIYLI